MTGLQLGVLILGLAGIAAGAEPALKKEGAYWVHVLTGSEALTPSARVRITSRGSVTLNGASQNELWYSLKVRVKAPTEAAARQLVRAFGAHVARQDNGYTSLIVHRGNGLADLQVKIPRTAPETAIATTEGALDFSDLDGSVTADTGGGAVKADRIRGNVVVRTAGGDITLGSVEGNARCATAGGKITANLIRGEATFETGGGDIFAEDVVGLVRASTQAGKRSHPARRSGRGCQHRWWAYRCGTRPGLGNSQEFCRAGASRFGAGCELRKRRRRRAACQYFRRRAGFYRHWQYLRQPAARQAHRGFVSRDGQR